MLAMAQLLRSERAMMKIGAVNWEIVRPLWKIKWPNSMIFDSSAEVAVVSNIQDFHNFLYTTQSEH